MASRKLFAPSTAVYQAGRGSEPMIEVGRATPADALYIAYPLLLLGCRISRTENRLPLFWKCSRLEIECFALGRRLVRQECAVGLGQRRAGIAEAVHDRIAAVAAEILERHLDPRRR